MPVYLHLVQAISDRHEAGLLAQLEDSITMKVCKLWNGVYRSDQYCECCYRNGTKDRECFHPKSSHATHLTCCEAKNHLFENMYRAPLKAVSPQVARAKPRNESLIRPAGHA